MALVSLPGRYWWVYALAGAVSILFGLAAILWPGETLFVLVLLFGVFALVDGVLSLVDVFAAMGEHRPWWPQLIIGAVGILAGLFVLAYPGITALILLYVIAFWAIVIGLMDISVSLVHAQFLLLVAGIISVVFGFVLLGNLREGALGLVIAIGVFAIVRGIVLLVHAVRAPQMPTFPV